MVAGATNRTVGRLIRDVEDDILVPRPDFQRRLVWNNRDKNHFIQTVLLGLPFPEIYVATGAMDVQTGRGNELLVDGQQRVTTLLQYFKASPLLRLQQSVPAYQSLPEDQKLTFLQYPVAVRELGSKSDAEIREIFQRINATAYTLNDMEINNAIYQGPFRQFAQAMAEHQFLADHRMFTIRETRRMLDVSYLVTVLISMMRSYPNREDEHEEFLSTYNEEFPEEADLRRRLDAVFATIDACDFPPRSRAWKNAEFLVLAVELDRLLETPGVAFDRGKLKDILSEFYRQVDAAAAKNREPDAPRPTEEVADYYATLVQATGDRQNRAARGKALRRVLHQAVVVNAPGGPPPPPA